MLHLSIVTIADVACIIAPNLVEERSHELRTVCGEVEAILDARPGSFPKVSDN